MTIPCLSSVDDLADSLGRIERIGQTLADRFGASHFSFFSASSEFWLVAGNPQLFPATCWEPFNTGKAALCYEKGTLNLSSGYKVIMLRPAT